jgi:Co/Zn/Cd efflux system component
MDCPSEEQLIRTALSPLAVVLRVTVSLEDRTIVVTHQDHAQSVLDALEPLGLGGEIIASNPTDERPQVANELEAGDERRVLRQVLAINGFMFVGEFIAGWLADSTGLLADALDMLADALVYSISLYAVSRGPSVQSQAARWSGIAQMSLALLLLVEVIRRSIYGGDPKSVAMMLVSAAALAANVTCVWLLRRHRDRGVHMQASWIFSTNDALANLGVMIAGALVLATGSQFPDLAIGSIIAIIVARGALRILRLPTPGAGSTVD